jgi:hypothetical protein
MVKCLVRFVWKFSLYGVFLPFKCFHPCETIVVCFVGCDEFITSICSVDKYYMFCASDHIVGFDCFSLKRGIPIVDNVGIWGREFLDSLTPATSGIVMPTLP